jgi:cobyrinic acid a,c-diamide synthase
MIPCIVIAAPSSGAGKTTVALALMAALRQRGLVVQPFKVGPDFIDPGHHTAVCARPSRNLDNWMLNDDAVRATIARAVDGADIAVIEGVMGLFDGRDACDHRGSTAAIARLFGAPVILVVDASAMAASVAALVKGFADFDPTLRIAGVICNQVAGPRHYAYLEPAIRRHTSVEPLGWLPRDPAWSIPERHLGLTTVDDLTATSQRWQALGMAFTEHVNVDRMLELARSSQGKIPGTEESSPRPTAALARVRIAVSRDAAFCFYYADNLELLAEAGGDIAFFSPLVDTTLPHGTQLLYLGGGYPELHGRQLSENRPMLDSIRRFHAANGIIYAECGGLMYCCRELIDQKNVTHATLDLLPARTIMQERRAALGYVTWRATADGLFGPKGTEVRGHEFHYSRLEPLGPLTPAAELCRPGEAKPDGYVNRGLLAGYAHLHFGSQPKVATSMLARASRDA